MLDNPSQPFFRDATPEDIPALVKVGGDFFRESEFPDFATFSSENFETTLKNLIGSDAFRMHVFAPADRIVGFIAYALDVSYTKEPIALLWLLYVDPEYRKTPAGRLLVQLATESAKLDGCCAFYAGAMSGVPGTGKTLANMYRKQGFSDLDFWGKKIL